MMKFVFACLFFLFYCVCDDECNFKVQEKDNSPIVLNENYSWFRDVKKGGIVRFNLGEHLILYCPSTTHILKRPNFLLASGSETTNITCYKENIIVYTYGSQKLPLDSELIKCDHEFIGAVKLLNEGRCARGENGKRSQLWAFRFSIERTCFIDFFYICYDFDTRNMIYAVHLLHGGEGTPSSYQETCDCRDNDLYFLNKSMIKNAYSLQNQLKMKSGAVTRDSYFTQAYLVPYLDIPYPGLHCTIYCRQISTPMRNRIVVGNWKEMEEMIRQYAYQTGETLRIYTGTTSNAFMHYGNKDDGYKTIYLLKNQFVPACVYVWKIVHSFERNAAIVFLVINSVTSSKDDWRSVCDENGWGSSSWNIQKRGYLYCFSYEDFPYIEEAPELPKVGLLQGPN